MTNGEQLRILTERPQAAEGARAHAGGRQAAWRKRGGELLHSLRKRPLRRLSGEKKKPRLSVGERLIRNSAVACALLLTLMAVRNLDTPWSNRITQSIRSAVSMRVDWDETIGRLSFVRALIPDTALVFLNMSDQDALKAPAEGTLRHAFSEDQPYLEYACEAGAPVRAAQAGTVSAVGCGAGGDYIVLMQHEQGESVYGYLASAQVEVGQQLEQGAEVGRSSERLYFEWREEGKSVDPRERLGG